MLGEVFRTFKSAGYFREEMKARCRGPGLADEVAGRERRFIVVEVINDDVYNLCRKHFSLKCNMKVKSVLLNLVSRKIVHGGSREYRRRSSERGKLSSAAASSVSVSVTHFLDIVFQMLLVFFKALPLQTSK